MGLDQLKVQLGLRSYWNQGAEVSFLPMRNLTRHSYIGALKQLRDVDIVVSLMGQRRSGKSVIARQYMQALWDEGLPRSNILYINFFLKTLAGLRNEQVFQEIVYWWLTTVVDQASPSYLILDEVHELQFWDENVASLFEDPLAQCKILITGSNSKLLSEELSSQLGGRYVTIPVFSFSYQEYCDFHQIQYNSGNIEAYLRDGGMPEVLKTKDEEQRTQLLSDIITSTVRNDIVARYNPSNPQLLYSLIDFCRSSFSQQLSVRRIAEEVLRGMRVRIKDKGRTTSLVESYIKYLSDVYFLDLPKTYSYRTKDTLKRTVDKVYLRDLSIAEYQSKTQRGRLLENMIYLELRKKGYNVQRFLGYRNRNLEIDFHIERRDKSALVQVCWLLGDEVENVNLWQREFGNLADTKLDTFKCVVSLDDSLRSPYAGVEHMNVIEFLAWLDEL